MEYWTDCGRTYFGATIETNRFTDVSKAPTPNSRFMAMRDLSRIKGWGFKTFITIEPILKFDMHEFSRQIISANPDFINIGADSKGIGLYEPSADDVMELVALIQKAGIEIRQKHNLERLLAR
jgi:hypothetical protein